MPYAVLRVLCLSPLAVLAMVATATTANAADGWSVAPSGGGRPSFYAEGTPGTVLQDTVSVTNRGEKPVTVRLRATGIPVTFAKDGAGRDRTEGSLTIPARTRADIPFTVTVPSTAAPGDRAGAILARDTDGRTATVRLRLRAGGPALSALTVEHVVVRADRITYDLVNRGTTVLVPRLAVHADGVFGTVLDRAPRTLPVHLPPGTRTRLGEPWPDRPALDSVDVRLTVTAAGGAHATAGTSARFVPWGAVAGIGAVMVVTTALEVLRRRRRRTVEDGGRAGQPHTEVELTGAVT